MASVARIVSQRSHLVAGKLKITEHFFEVPRDYSKPDAGTLKLFARSAIKADKPASPDEEEDPKKKQLPWVVYLQGGPGHGCRSPQQNTWNKTILDKGYQVLCLDQRGTGLSSPLSASSLGLRGDEQVQADYLRSFRADNIVRDCEAVRQALTADYPEFKKKWSVMGQSYGGFCITTYLSLHPEGLREAFIFGGLPPLSKSPDEPYTALFKRVEKRNETYYEKYPEDVESVRRIIKHLRQNGDSTVRLPSEGSLSARRFQQLGLSFGFHGGMDQVHDIILRASNDLSNVGHLTRPTLSTIEHALPFDDAIIYAILHEPIYCQGSAANWSAHRLKESLPAFSLDKNDGPIYFTGETIFPWMFEDYAELRKIAKPAELVARFSDWPVLYDEEQLSKNEVPVYAAVYMEDMYVDFNLSMATADKIKGCKTFVSNVMYHDAVRSKVDVVLKNVFDLRDDVLD